jgi:hypothetical protein
MTLTEFHRIFITEIHVEGRTECCYFLSGLVVHHTTGYNTNNKTNKNTTKKNQYKRKKKQQHPN